MAEWKSEQEQAEEAVASLAYRFQVLRCWILNNLVDERAGQSAELRQKAIAILEETKDAH